MDPLSALFAGFQGNMPGMGAGAAATTPGADTLGNINPMGDLSKVLAGIRAPESPKPIMSGGVSGVGLPFLQQMPNLLTPALTAAMQRMSASPQTPSLGQLLGGGR
jgi:hypothetical protein